MEKIKYDPLRPATDTLWLSHRYFHLPNKRMLQTQNTGGLEPQRPTLADVKMLKEPEGRTRFLSEDERVCYLDACKKISPTLYTASMIALTTGGRKMEVWDLKRADVHIAKEEGERSFYTCSGKQKPDRYDL